MKNSGHLANVGCVITAVRRGIASELRRQASANSSSELRQLSRTNPEVVSRCRRNSTFGFASLCVDRSSWSVENSQRVGSLIANFMSAFSLAVITTRYQVSVRILEWFTRFVWKVFRLFYYIAYIVLGKECDTGMSLGPYCSVDATVAELSALTASGYRPISPNDVLRVRCEYACMA